MSPFRQRRRWGALPVCLGLALFASVELGCAGSPLLRREQVQEGRWRNFEEVKAAFDQIEPGKTTLAELRELRFDPASSQASTLVTYVDVVRAFVPNAGLPIEDASEEVQRCAKIRERCTAWLVSLNRERRKRIGNFALDWLLFRRISRTTGWSFEAFILIENGRVLYKIWSGVPAVLRYRARIRPLGFLQDAAIIVPAVFTLTPNTGEDP